MFLVTFHYVTSRWTESGNWKVEKGSDGKYGQQENIIELPKDVVKWQIGRWSEVQKSDNCHVKNCFYWDYM